MKIKIKLDPGAKMPIKVSVDREMTEEELGEQDELFNQQAALEDKGDDSDEH